ncbi:MAG: hypothetical protein MUF86_12495 [Akkermansiaceae bacterium]|nr:hypothetical protein [Akkermansiaceae bacterium]
MDLLLFALGFLFAALTVLAFGVCTVGPTQRGIITRSGRRQILRHTPQDREHSIRCGCMKCVFKKTMPHLDMWIFVIYLTFRLIINVLNKIATSNFIRIKRQLESPACHGDDLHPSWPPIQFILRPIDPFR